MRVIKISKLEEYKGLLSITYDEMINYLYQKYGFVQDDYYRESSYERFMNGEIKSITKGKFSRTDEGLYCHHVDEYRMLNISNKEFIKKFNIPYEYQRKDRLVYCDLIEHAILHVLIAKETDHKFGYPGYEAFIKPDLIMWYLENQIPESKWRRNCYKTAYLKPEEVFEIIKEMELTLGNKYYNSFSEYKKIEKEKDEKEEKRRQERVKMLREERAKKIESFSLLHEKDLRKIILYAHYYLKYEYPKGLIYLGRNKDFTEYEKEMKVYTKEDILKEVHLILSDLPALPDNDGDLNIY